MYSSYDDETLLIDGISKERFYGDFDMSSIYFHNGNYEANMVRMPKSELEYSMRLHKNIVVAIDIGSAYVLMVDHDGIVTARNDRTSEQNFDSYTISKIPMCGSFMSVGIASTLCGQVEIPTMPESIYYDLAIHEIFVLDGFKKVDFCSVDELDFGAPIPLNLYQLVVSNGDSYIVPTKNSYLILDRELNIKAKIERRKR